MPYASQTELQYAAGGEERLLQFADWNADGVLDQNIVDQALVQADAFIDQYLSLRYATPIQAPSALLRGLAAEHAIYHLKQTRGLVGEEENRQLDFRTRQLEAMRDGRLRPDEPAPVASSAVRAEFVGRDPRSSVSRDNLKGFS